MFKPPLHKKEVERQKAVDALNLFGGDPDPRFDALTKEATEKLNVPMSTVSIINKDKEIYIGNCGIENKDGPRDISFCGHTLVNIDAMMICEDTKEDPRFADNPYVSGPPYVRFYAGLKLIDKKTNLPIGVFCIKDTKPRKLSIQEIGDFLEFGNKAEDMLNE